MVRQAETSYRNSKSVGIDIKLANSLRSDCIRKYRCSIFFSRKTSLVAVPCNPHHPALYPIDAGTAGTEIIDGRIRRFS